MGLVLPVEVVDEGRPEVGERLLVAPVPQDCVDGGQCDQDGGQHLRYDEDQRLPLLERRRHVGRERPVEPVYAGIRSSEDCVPEDQHRDHVEVAYAGRTGRRPDDVALQVDLVDRLRGGVAHEVEVRAVDQDRRGVDLRQTLCHDLQVAGRVQAVEVGAGVGRGNEVDPAERPGAHRDHVPPEVADVLVPVPLDQDVARGAELVHGYPAVELAHPESV